MQNHFEQSISSALLNNIPVIINYPNIVNHLQQLIDCLQTLLKTQKRVLIVYDNLHDIIAEQTVLKSQNIDFLTIQPSRKCLRHSLKYENQGFRCWSTLSTQESQTQLQGLKNIANIDHTSKLKSICSTIIKLEYLNNRKDSIIYSNYSHFLKHYKLYDQFHVIFRSCHLLEQNLYKHTITAINTNDITQALHLIQNNRDITLLATRSLLIQMFNCIHQHFVNFFMANKQQSKAKVFQYINFNQQQFTHHIESMLGLDKINKGEDAIKFSDLMKMIKEFQVSANLNNSQVFKRIKNWLVMTSGNYIENIEGVEVIQDIFDEIDKKIKEQEQSQFSQFDESQNNQIALSYYEDKSIQERGIIFHFKSTMKEIKQQLSQRFTILESSSLCPVKNFLSDLKIKEKIVLNKKSDNSDKISNLRISQCIEYSQNLKIDITSIKNELKNGNNSQIAKIISFIKSINSLNATVIIFTSSDSLYQIISTNIQSEDSQSIGNNINLGVTNGAIYLLPMSFQNIELLYKKLQDKIKYLVVIVLGVPFVSNSYMEHLNKTQQQIGIEMMKKNLESENEEFNEFSMCSAIRILHRLCIKAISFSKLQQQPQSIILLDQKFSWTQISTQLPHDIQQNLFLTNSEKELEEIKKTIHALNNQTEAKQLNSQGLKNLMSHKILASRKTVSPSKTQGDIPKGSPQSMQKGDIFTCCICWETGINLFKSTHCGHQACEQCWDKWLENKLECPMCRKRVRKKFLDRVK